MNFTVKVEGTHVVVYRDGHRRLGFEHHYPSGAADEVAALLTDAANNGVTVTWPSGQVVEVRRED